MTATASLVGRALGNYRILSLIGIGGMGQVYRARDERLNREVAIKIIHPARCNDPGALPRFEQEARTLAALNHPNLLAIYDVGTQDGLPYIVSELLEGETLRSRLVKERLPYHRAIDFAMQIVRALVAAHEKGIVHRDLKPENIFLTNDGHLKILDFGLAKLIESEHSGTTTANADTPLHTDSGGVVGTVAYMSPEQVRAQKVDHRSDVFSFGTILFEMLTQKRVFSGQTTADVVTAILTEEPRNLSEINPHVPPTASLVIQHCIEKRREDRFQSAKDLLFDLTLLSNNLHSSGTIVPTVESRRPHLRHALWGAAACIVAGATIAIGFSAFHPTVTPLPSYTQLTFRRGDVTSARFTGDGNTVLYTASWNGAPSDTFFVRPGTTESRSLGLSNADLLSVSSKGELAVLLRRKDSQPWFDTGTLARVPVAGGTPREIVENVQTADWSPDGSSFAIVRRVEDRQRLEFPIGKVLFETAGWLTDIRISPRGDQIAFMEHGSLSDDRGWVSVVDLNGKAQRLTEEFASERGLAWSPRGKEIWFTATRSGEAFELLSVSLNQNVHVQARVPTSLTIYDVAQDGTVLLSSSKITTPIIGLPPGETVEHDLSSLDRIDLTSLSDDGKTFLFQYYGQGSGFNYSSYLGSTDGSPPVRLGAGSAVALSPDGKWVITDDKLGKTVLQPIGAGDVRVLDRTGFTDAGDDTWCPDGTCIVFTGKKAGRVARSYTEDLKGGKPVPFGPDGVTNPVLSPDGKLVLGRKGEKYVIFDRNGDKVREVRGLEAEDRITRWSQKHRDLYVYRVRHDIQLFELDPDTGFRRMLREIPSPDRVGISGTPQLFVSADGKSYVYSFYRKISELYLARNIAH